MTQAYKDALKTIKRAKTEIQDVIENTVKDVFELNAIDSYLDMLLDIEKAIKKDSKGKKVSIKLDSKIDE